MYSLVRLEAIISLIVHMQKSRHREAKVPTVTNMVHNGPGSHTALSHCSKTDSWGHTLQSQHGFLLWGKWVECFLFEIAVNTSVLTYCQLLLFWLPCLPLPHGDKYISGCLVTISLGTDFLSNPQAWSLATKFLPCSCFLAISDWIWFGYYTQTRPVISGHSIPGIRIKTVKDQNCKM